MVTNPHQSLWASTSELALMIPEQVQQRKEGQPGAEQNG